ncbi:MAG: AAA family ATPase [Bacteroidaceae bacterium]|nr:AAA family ATPase [Bacteroidaceae bacterium]
MIHRKADEWIDNHFRNTKKALLLTGARQVGKTYAVRRAAERLGWHLVEMNFLLQPETIDIVRGAGDIKEVLLRISAYANVPLDWAKTLIFFDEVEEYPDVMTWVKAFVDKGYHLALSGSLLGVELNNVRSVPVGYMDEKQIFPCDFEEFIRAVGVQDTVIESIRDAWNERKPVDAYVHQKMMLLLNLYLLVGGMPAAVQTYLDTNDMQRVLLEQRSILALYKKDIGRYDPEDKLYINDIFDLIPPELNAKNKRFILKKLNEHFKFSRHENSFTWLRDADMALPTHCAEEPKVPLVLSKASNLFKLFQNDVGLLACQYADGIQLRILQGETNINYGAIYENLTAQELHAHGWSLFYFQNKKQGELDFLLEKDTEIIPLEVKSGKDYARHVALNNVMSNPEYGIQKAIVLCNDNLSTRGNITYAPIYMLMFIEKLKDEEPKIYKLDLGGLI